MDVDSQIQDLIKQHTLLAARIDALNERPWLTEREHFERKRLQKLKLKTKDEIAFLRSRKS